jgi:hypothetical protein
VSAPVRNFIRHYLEMVAAMFIGMAVLGVPAEAGLKAIGTSASALETDAPAVLLLGMALIMTAPMVGWMRYRGHGWRPNAEMAASMFIPTVGIVGVMATGMVSDFMTLMMAEHVVMFPSMLAAMLIRPQEYTGHGHEVQEAIA